MNRVIELNRDADCRFALPAKAASGYQSDRGLYLVTFVLAAFLCLLCRPNAFAQSMDYGDYGDIIIKNESDSAKSQNGQGYVEIRFRVTNRSGSVSHQIALQLLAVPYENGCELMRAVEIAPNTSVVVSLWQPPLVNVSNSVTVTIDGRLQVAPMSVSGNLNRGSYYGSGQQDDIHLLTSKKVNDSGIRGVVAGALSVNSSDISWISLDATISDRHRNWLSYSGYQGVVLSADEVREMPSEVRNALMSYVESGGSLLVLGSWPVTESWQSRQEAFAQRAGQTPGDKNTLYMTYCGLGTLMQNSGEMSQEQWLQVEKAWQKASGSYRATQGMANPFKTFPVVSNLAVPIRGLFVLMLLFVVVIGPLNLFLLARRNKRIWLLWTIPAISLMTSLTVAGYAFFSEGLSRRNRAEILTILDETGHRAATIGMTAFYSALTPGDGLHFSYDTELTPELPESFYYGYRRSNNRWRTLDWTRDQHLASGWITARIPANFRVRKNETRRERLSVAQSGDGTVQIVNGLGANIVSVFLADSRGRIHKATNVVAGAQAQLTPTDLLAVGEKGALRDVFSQNWLSEFQRIETTPMSVLMPNTYLAVLDATPFLEEGLANIQVRKQKNLVYGILPVSQPQTAESQR